MDEVRDLMASGAPLVLGDVRTERSWLDDDLLAMGAIRLPPEDAVRTAREMGLGHHATVVLLLCVKGRSDKHPGGARLATGGLARGRRALVGGWAAWKRKKPACRWRRRGDRKSIT